jgi:hypothetical protein
VTDSRPTRGGFCYTGYPIAETAARCDLQLGKRR